MRTYSSISDSSPAFSLDNAPKKNGVVIGPSLPAAVSLSVLLYPGMNGISIRLISDPSPSVRELFVLLSPYAMAGTRVDAIVLFHDSRLPGVTFHENRSRLPRPS